MQSTLLPPECHHRISPESQPDDGGKEDRDHGKEPDAFCRDVAFAPDPELFSSPEKASGRRGRTRNMPPPIKRTGNGLLRLLRATGSPENVAVSAPTGPRDGADIQTISHGSTPRIAKTANRRPQTRNQRRAFSDIVERTSALIMALSMLVMVSNRQSPAMIRRMERISMERNYVGAGTVLNLAKPALWENPGSIQVRW